MAIRAVVFDIGGILEIIPEGGDPTQRFPDMIARWEDRLGLAPGELDRRITAMDERFSAAGKRRLDWNLYRGGVAGGTWPSNRDGSGADGPLYARLLGCLLWRA